MTLHVSWPFRLGLAILTVIGGLVWLEAVWTAYQADTALSQARALHRQGQADRALRLLGLAAFLGFWILVLGKGARSPAGTGIKVGLIALLLHGLTDGNLTFIPANAVLAYLLAGLYVGEMDDPD